MITMRTYKQNKSGDGFRDIDGDNIVSRKRRLRGSLGEVRLDSIYRSLEDVLVEIDRIYISVNAVKDCLEADFYEEEGI